MKPYVPGEFATKFSFCDDDLPFARSKREYRDYQRFDKALKEAQTSEKEHLTKNINLAAQIAVGLNSADAIKHVVSRLCLISKDPAARKETAVYAADSIMRHVSVCDEVLSARYEKQLSVHLRNMFKRALHRETTRKSLATKFFTKVLTKWKQKGWFARDLDSIVDVVSKATPGLQKPGELMDEPDLDNMVDAIDMTDDGPTLPTMSGQLGRGASAKAGAPPTPTQPDFLMRPVPSTPNMSAMPPGPPPRPPQAGPPPHGAMPQMPQVSQVVLTMVPATPRPDVRMIPMTPAPGAMPSTPNLTARMPSTPNMTARIPSTPIAAFARAAGAAPGTPGAAQPFTPALGAQPFTPVAAAAPGTPGSMMQPFTPRPPVAGGAQPFTPAGQAPGTPGAAQPFTPAAGAQPFTPGQAPGTPGAQPFTPRGPAPATPGAVQPFTPRGPPPPTSAGGAQPFTPGAQPFTPGANPSTPAFGAQPFTPAFQPFTPAAPGTPGMSAPGTPGFLAFRAGDIAPVTPAPGTRLGAPATPATGSMAPGTPGFIAFSGGEAAPQTPAVEGLGSSATKTAEPSKVPEFRKANPEDAVESATQQTVSSTAGSGQQPESQQAEQTGVAAELPLAGADDASQPASMPVAEAVPAQAEQTGASEEPQHAMTVDAEVVPTDQTGTAKEPQATAAEGQHEDTAGNSVAAATSTTEGAPDHPMTVDAEVVPTDQTGAAKEPQATAADGQHEDTAGNSVAAATSTTEGAPDHPSQGVEATLQPAEATERLEAEPPAKRARVEDSSEAAAEADVTVADSLELQLPLLPTQPSREEQDDSLATAGASE